MSATNQQREFDLSFSISSLELNDRSLDQVFDFMDVNGAITVNATANNVPAGLLCNALTVNPSLGQKIDAVVGETLDGKMDLSLERKSGLINLDWQSPRSSLTLVAKMKK
jgi:hypothetical protein